MRLTLVCRAGISRRRNAERHASLSRSDGCASAASTVPEQIRASRRANTAVKGTHSAESSQHHSLPRNNELLLLIAADGRRQPPESRQPCLLLSAGNDRDVSGMCQTCAESAPAPRRAAVRRKKPLLWPPRRRRYLVVGVEMLPSLGQHCLDGPQSPCSC